MVVDRIWKKRTKGFGQSSGNPEDADKDQRFTIDSTKRTVTFRILGSLMVMVLEM